MDHLAAELLLVEGNLGALAQCGEDDIRVVALAEQRERLRIHLGELIRQRGEWSFGPELPLRPFHVKSMWKERAGTEVPLCHSRAARRPGGNPILVDALNSDCVYCLAVLGEKFA